MWRVLDAVLLVTIVAAPWALLVYALSRFRSILRQDWRILLLLAVGLWLFFTMLLPPLTETPVQAILHSTTKPWFSAYVSSVLDGRAPLWLPQLGTGLPALANPYVAYMSPFTSVLLLFDDLDQGVNVLVIVHLVFAGLSGFLLGRSFGLSRSAALLLALPLMWNPWVFRRLATEVHALYIFGFAWLPLTWALLLQFLRTKQPGDAIATGIPLAFMAVSMPTVFAQTGFVVEFFLAVAAARELVRRRWPALGRLALGAVAIAAGGFLAAAPEHLAARELFQYTEGTRFERTRITGGWRDKDLSVPEFLRVLLPHQLGAALVPLSHPVDSFGVPFSPGDAVVVIAAIGVGGTLLRRSRRRAVVASHLLLFLVLASVATHGPAYEPVHRAFPLWGFAGNFPVVGALLLMILCVCFGFGVETLQHAAARLAERLWTTPGGRLRLVRLGRRLILTAGGALLTVEILWGLGGVLRVVRGADPDGRADLRFNIPAMPLKDLDKLPHLAFLKAQTRDTELPARIYCIGDRGIWPSPCFDYAVDRAGLEAVGIGELAWAMPRWQWNVFTPLWGAWDGAVPPLLDRLLRLASVQYLVTTRDLDDLELVARIPWEPAPGNFELYGKFLASSIGGGRWTEGWDGRIRIHAFPGFPRAFFADAVRITGNEQDATIVVRDILSRDSFHPRKLIFLHDGPQTSDADVPVLGSDQDSAAAREAFLASFPARSRPVENVKLRLHAQGAGAWAIEGQLPHPGALLVSQMYYPGMRATVNGQPAPVLRADLFLSAIPVPAGEVRATLEYAPRGILASSLLTASFAAFLVFLTFRRPKL